MTLAKHDGSGGGYDVRRVVNKKRAQIYCARPPVAGHCCGSDTEEEVLRKAQADLQALLIGGRIIQLDLEAEPEGHPWQPFAGMFADDPDWDAFQASLQQYREDIDRAIAEE
jgi:hypothetical protein